MKIKVCGNKFPKEFSELDALQVDYLGLIFHEASPRNIVQEHFSSSSAEKIGVFVNQSKKFIEDKIAKYDLSGIQLHGEESPDFCFYFKEKGILTIKAIRIENESDFETIYLYEEKVDYILLDTKGKTYGGVGKKFDWNLLAHYTSTIPYFLSGGISSEDAEAILAIEDPRFQGIDLNSKFEIAPGQKNVALVNQFIQKIHGKV